MISDEIVGILSSLEKRYGNVSAKQLCDAVMIFYHLITGEFPKRKYVQLEIQRLTDKRRIKVNDDWTLNTTKEI